MCSKFINILKHLIVTRQEFSSRIDTKELLFMKKEMQHVVKVVEAGSIAEQMGIEIADKVLEIAGMKIEDIFDYQYLIQDEYIEVLIEKPDGEQWILEIEKDFDEDLGIEFENGLMDEYRSCTNQCIFCFIDQMPKGMRETLYFKDDDSRLSFLQGNYVTLTNMSEHDIDRIIKYHLSPINVSFQTTNPKLRCEMLKNRFAGEALKKVDRLFEAGITMNGQIVLCKGVNDGEELERSISDLFAYLPCLESVSVVPVGLSKYRDGLYPLEPFTKEDAIAVLDTIHKWQEKAIKEHELHFIHASDEWYILAERDIPQEDNYDGYLQLENGVGMMRLLLDEVTDAISQIKNDTCIDFNRKQTISMATGLLAYPYIKKLADDFMQVFDQLTIHVYPITNEFFGERITVAGLLTGGDVIAQLKGKSLGERLLLPIQMLRSGEMVFLDDVTVSDVQNALQVRVDIVKSSGYDLASSITNKTFVIDRNEE